jgi:hypothetical protein
VSGIAVERARPVPPASGQFQKPGSGEYSPSSSPHKTPPISSNSASLQHPKQKLLPRSSSFNSFSLAPQTRAFAGRPHRSGTQLPSTLKDFRSDQYGTRSAHTSVDQQPSVRREVPLRHAASVPTQLFQMDQRFLQRVNIYFLFYLLLFLFIFSCSKFV